jgi:hypothetical protein
MAAALRLVGYQKKKGQTSLTNVLTTTIRKPERRMTHRVQKRVTTLSIKQTRNHPLHTHTHTHTQFPLSILSFQTKISSFLLKNTNFQLNAWNQKEKIFFFCKSPGGDWTNFLALVRVQSCNHHQMKKKKTLFTWHTHASYTHAD